MSIPISTLNKRNNENFYHRVREANVDEIIWVGWVEDIINSSNFFTKIAIYIPTRQGIISNIFNNIVGFITLGG